MDSDGPETQPTQQATQNVLDPRRLGKQNSGFSDDDIADIICLLLPYSDGSRAELREMALRTSQHMVDADEAAHPDLQAAEGLSLMPHLVGEHALVLRLSAHVKDPLQGFTFGRNVTRCDVCFHNDPMRRLSNIHFRIYLNEYGVLMLEDSSINGTVVDGTLLKARQGDRAKTGEKKLPKRRTINPGSKIQILMHEGQDDLDFIVQIPRREGDYEETYRRNLTRYMKRLQHIRAENEPVDAAKTITAGPGGHVDLFPVNETKQPTPRAKRQLRLPDDPTQEDMGRLPKEWNGSNRYNRVGRIGKGAFATVYKVTAKFDGKPYAAKELDKRKFMKNGVLDQKVENEMRIMQKVKHPNIVEYIEHIDWDDRLMIIIMEYVPNGDLGSLIGENGPLREDIVREMSSQMLSALSYLHANNITHRDVKPDNILCHSYSPFIVKLTDFGLSKMVETEQTFLKTFCGTLLYCAPEVYNEFAEYDEYGHRHPRNRQRRRPVAQRDDGIGDDEDLNLEQYDGQGVDAVQFDGYESQKENYTFVSLDRTEILDPEIKDSYGRSLDEINNMTFDAESQDLEGAESQLEHLNMKSLLPSNGLSYMSSFNTSKRKPGYDSSDEFDNTPRARPPIKKLRSDSLFGDAMSWDEDSEQGFDRPLSLDDAGNEDEDMADTLPTDHGTVLPAQADPPLNRVVATLESADGSVVSGISVPINQAMISWGRAPENTHIYTPKTESKVPKYALKVILWKDGYEPSKNFRPWNSAADGFHFYMSTKATNGIQINKTVLSSDEPKNPKGPSKNWIKLHDGDLVTFWRSGDGDEQLKARLAFHCSWGGSSQPRDTPAELVLPDLADCLDASCRKAEDRIKKLAEYDHSLEEADLDALERHKNIERERLRSQNFETKRLEACRVLAMRASRRSSPASASPIVPPSSAPPAIMTGVGAIPRHRSVPALKHATSGLDARALQTMAEE
ncbi:putative meiosis-specific serine threonine-protein kinase mek1 [Diaporthe ampelina]|uniref:Autophagy-related protein 1 n=1 Tax=Diaporthe ampelina TaxID=1214573 RepID=A0A0G2FVT9_9PEZI|nr:putative meiosis-specific serine threonine-protein kinase mek1 [Diaporthe ampelina]